MPIDKEGKVTLDKSFFGEKTALLCKSGAGKSYFARVIIEEGLALGVPFIIIDPQDAYLNLPDFEYIDVKNIKSAKNLGILLAKTNRNTVISTKGLAIEEQNKFMKAFLRSYRLHVQRGIHTVLIDEGHKFAPESEKTESKDEIRGMFQENRSDGLGVIILSQRIQRLDKTVISQADNMACGRVKSFRDKESIKNYLENPDDADGFNKFKDGEFHITGFGSEEGRVINVRKSNTTHSGDSPKDLLKEDRVSFDKNASRVLKKTTKLKNDNKGKEKMTQDNILPSKSSIKDLTITGVQIAIGGTLAGIVGSMVGGRIPNVGMVSGRTLGSAGTSIIMFAASKASPVFKDSLKFGTAGSMAFTLGSATMDALNAFGINLPEPANFFVASSTGVSPVINPKQKPASLDLTTQFADDQGIIGA